MKITGLRSFMSRDGNRPRVIVAIDTDEGITGWGSAITTAPTGPCRRCWTISTPRSRARTRAGSNV
ncbi:hypothetical protein [Mameliella alba]|uniref:hypothetical protein n=1 Tax=Mameliella alba TaxID=561184 RepID=UPI00256EA860|nr:hypothetical protein [Mameliella alba]